MGLFFFCLFLFDAGIVFLGYDIVVGLFLIRLAFFANIRLRYARRGFVYAIGYLRWLVVSQSRLNNKVYLWDNRWLELRGAQGVYRFLSAFSSFDKVLGLGLTFLAVLLLI